MIDLNSMFCFFFFLESCTVTVDIVSNHIYNEIQCSATQYERAWKTIKMSFAMFVSIYVFPDLCFTIRHRADGPKVKAFTSVRILLRTS